MELFQTPEFTAEKIAEAYYGKTNADRIRSMTDEELAAYLEEVELAAVRAYGNDDLLLKGELRAWWLLRLKKEFDANAKSI